MRGPAGRHGKYFLALLLMAAAPAPPETVDAVLALTRTTKATYAVCTWNVVTPSADVQVKEWAAEYHQGDRHRVETPRDRIIANCATGEAQHLDVRTGAVSTSPSLAAAACGVDANRKLMAKQFLGRETGGRYGPVSRIAVEDDGNRRTYDVLDDGAIIAATIRDNVEDETERLNSAALSYSHRLPEADIFSTASLGRSVVTESCRSEHGG